MQENYKILGVSEDATDEEIDAQYKKLKERYSRERFYEGEIGNDAAKNLTKLETAYAEILEARKETASSSSYEPQSYVEVENLIKESKISDAQARLDDIVNRDAEWHYLQSVIYYKKNWMGESKKQLEIAMNMEPSNEKYTDSYTKLKQKMEFNEKQFHSGNANYSTGETRQSRQMGGTDSGDCLSFCATWCCMDLMCNMCCR